MLHQPYRKANALLNQHIVELSDESITLRIHYWGFMPKHHNTPLHRHSFFEICYVLDGSGSYEDDKSVYELQKGALFCSRPGIWHQIRSETGLELFFVAFELMEERSSDIACRQFRSWSEYSSVLAASEEAQLSGDIWKAIFQCIQLPKAISRNLLTSLCMSLFYSFLQGLSKNTSIEMEQIVEESEEQRHLERARRYIEDNLSSALRVDQVAQDLFISSRHLSRIFQNLLGQTPVQYIQERRIQLAKELLLHSDLPIKDIANRIGYESVHYFTRVFSRLLGVSPAQFRKAQFSQGRRPEI